MKFNELSTRFMIIFMKQQNNACNVARMAIS